MSEMVAASPIRPRVVAIITARGGSKGLPGKNIALLSGKPLIAYSVAAAMDCPWVDRTVVTTDDPAIADIARQVGADIVMRPSALAGDAARSQDAVRHCLEALAAQGAFYDVFVLLQPTSPLRTACHVRQCLEDFFASGAVSAISVVEESHSPFKAFVLTQGMLHPLFERSHLSAPRQSLPRVYRQNGAIYVVRVQDFLNKDEFFIEPCHPYVMSEESSIDIDTHHDMKLAEFIISSGASEK